MLLAQVRLLSLVLVAGVLAGGQPTVGSVLALTIAALCVAVAASGLVGMSAPTTSFTSTLRDVVAKPLYRRQSDPDAAGRPRPRAPGVA
ncbi:MAG TPA: hypothetical protein DGT23_26950 [Micromonosporaceae bacterium]|nr:hypothetical protein [Micromonosporaceae bacterium]